MTRRARIAVVIGVLVGVQVVALLSYRAVQGARVRAPAATFAAQPLSGSDVAPAIEGQRADGSNVTLAWPAPHVRLVHFWGTWCAPCRDELPSLLAFARELRDRDLEVVAIAVDDAWPDVSAFFAGAVPPEVVMERDGAAHKRFGVSTLPDTYLVDHAGKLIERYHGARDWGTPAARAHLRARVP